MKQRRRTIGLLALIALLASAGCEETRVRQGAEQLGSLDPGVMRVLVSPGGIGRLVEVANPEGFLVRGEAQQLEVDGYDLSIGPVEQALPVSSRTASTGVGEVTVVTTFDNATVFVGMRVGESQNTRICRWRVSAAQLEADATAELTDTSEGARFEVVEPPQVDADGWSVSAIEDCGLPDEEPTRLEDLRPILEDYVRSAVAESTVATLETSPLDVLGLLRGSVELSRLSLFENRRGAVTVEARQSSSAGLELDDDGLTILLDAGVDARRAPCAPPITPRRPTPSGTADVDPAVVRRFGADYALAIGSSWVAEVAQGAALAGYACRGLEDARPPSRNEELIPVEDVMLGELGLGALPTGPWATIVMSPGTLPDVELEPGQGTVSVSWDALQLDLYATVFGANTRVGRVVTDIDLGLRPRSGSLDAAGFDIESVEVQPRRFESELTAVQPSEETLARWVRRTSLVLLEDAVTFPLPLLGATPARVVGTQVRTDDVVLFVRFEPEG